MRETCFGLTLLIVGIRGGLMKLQRNLVQLKHALALDRTPSRGHCVPVEQWLGIAQLAEHRPYTWGKVGKGQ
eukprot:2505106-Amphidinium_carterae.1